MNRTAVPTGVWLGATYALGRTVPVGEPYPHICSITVTGLMTGGRYQLWRRDCAACLAEAYDKRPAPDVDQTHAAQHAHAARYEPQED